MSMSRARVATADVGLDHKVVGSRWLEAEQAEEVAGEEQQAEEAVGEEEEGDETNTVAPQKELTPEEEEALKKELDYKLDLWDQATKDIDAEYDLKVQEKAKAVKSAKDQWDSQTNSKDLEPEMQAKFDYWEQYMQEHEVDPSSQNATITNSTAGAVDLGNETAATNPGEETVDEVIEKNTTEGENNENIWTESEEDIEEELENEAEGEGYVDGTEPIEDDDNPMDMAIQPEIDNTTTTADTTNTDTETESTTSQQESSPGDSGIDWTGEGAEGATGLVPKPAPTTVPPPTPTTLPQWNDPVPAFQLPTLAPGASSSFTFPSLFLYAGASILPLILICICRKYCCTGKSKDDLGEYRAVAAQYGDMSFDNTFSDRFSQEELEDMEVEKNEAADDSWANSGGKRVLEMGTLRRNGKSSASGKGNGAAGLDGLTLEEMNG